LPLYKGKPAGMAGYFAQGHDSNYIVLSLEGFDESAAITYHEYTHLLMKNAVRSLPVWLNEGLAEYYSTYRLIDRGKAAVIGRATSDHIALLRQRYIPLAELIEVDQSSPMYNEGERRSIFYAESWALTHYLMVATPDGGTAINQYVTAVAEGHSSVDAFQRAFGKPPSDFDKELQTYLRRLTFNAYRFQFPDTLTVAEPGPGRVLTAGEVDAWLGDAQRRVRRVDEGAPRIERAAAAEPDNATTQMMLGLLRLSQQNAPAALDAFGRAAALAPRDFLTQFVCGVSRVRADPRASDERRRLALATLKQAVSLNGASSDAYATLAYVQMLADDTLADARTSIEHAIALAPGRLDYRLRYADVRLLQGDIDAARSVLTSIAAIKFDSISAAAAKERLDAIARTAR
ncbi:MAG TPA: tetratricopeptide repeat protein, partial [Vicinamibacterales bacterium]|nr:tetratricopeptide repeat protein [Vicinamibacterales bacterium]